MAIHRAPRPRNYTSISSVPLNDTRISWDTRGLLLHLLAQADHWTVHVDALTKRGKGAGRTKIYSMLAEMQQLGYCKKTPKRGAQGRLAGWDYHISEEPDLADPAPPKQVDNRLRRSRNAATPHAVEPHCGETDTNYYQVVTNINNQPVVAVVEPLPRNWWPSQKIIDDLTMLAGYPADWIDAQVPTFVLYWRERGEPLRTSPDALFFDHCIQRSKMRGIAP